MPVQIDEIEKIPDLKRIETFSKNSMMGLSMEMTHEVYSHEELFTDFCPVHSYVNCPPEKVFSYMANCLSLEEWTYSLRNLRETNEKGLYKGQDVIGEHTDIYCRVEANREALTVDYHCAWDQGKDLWMIYLNRIVPAETVLNKPGSVIFWQNCHHPHYVDPFLRALCMAIVLWSYPVPQMRDITPKE